MNEYIKQLNYALEGLRKITRDQEILKEKLEFIRDGITEYLYPKDDGETARSVDAIFGVGDEKEKIT